MSRFLVETALQWVGVAAYVSATVGFAVAIVFGRTRWLGRARVLATSGLLPHGIAILLRWNEVGHGPYMLRGEVLSSNAWVAVALLALVLWTRPQWSALSLAALPGAFLMLAVGLTTSPHLKELPPTLRSIWLVFHVLFAKLAAGAFLLSLGSAVLLLRKARPGRPAGWLDRVPAADALDALTVRAAGFGLFFWTINIAAGAIWANESWGRYWGWDPIEIWSLVTWLAYGTFLHVRLFFRLKGTSTAWFAMAAFAVAVAAIFFLPVMTVGLHSSYFQ